MMNEAARPVRYRIQPININGALIGTKHIHNYVRESLLAIPPFLGFQRMIANLPGYVINDSE